MSVCVKGHPIVGKRCRTCKYAYNRQYLSRNPEKRKTYHREWKRRRTFLVQLYKSLASLKPEPLILLMKITKRGDDGKNENTRSLSD